MLFKYILRQTSPTIPALETGGGKGMVLCERLASVHSHAQPDLHKRRAHVPAAHLVYACACGSENVCVLARWPLPWPGCKPLMAHKLGTPVLRIKRGLRKFCSLKSHNHQECLFIFLAMPDNRDTTARHFQTRV